MNLEIQEFKADFFKALSHPLRIKILELLAQGDKSVNEMQQLLGSEGSAVSQQLMVLRSRSLVSGRKDGNRVIYSLNDAMVLKLLEVTRKIFNNHLTTKISMLDQ